MTFHSPQNNLVEDNSNSHNANPETSRYDDRFWDTFLEVGDLRGDASSWDEEIFGGMGYTLDEVHQALAA